MTPRILTKRRTTGKVLRALNDIFAPLRRVLELQREDDPYIDEALFKNKKNPLHSAQKLDNTIHLRCIPCVEDTIDAKNRLEFLIQRATVQMNELDARDLYLKQPSIDYIQKILLQAPNLNEKILHLKSMHKNIKLAIEHFANQLQGACEILQQILDNNLVSAEGNPVNIVRDTAIGRKMPKPKHDKSRGKLFLGRENDISIDVFDGKDSANEPLNNFNIALQTVQDAMNECEKNINSHKTHINEKELRKITKMLNRLSDSLESFNEQSAILIAKADHDTKVKKALEELNQPLAPVI